MTKSNLQPIQQSQGEKGFAVPFVMAIITVILVLGGVVYYANRLQTENNKMAEEKAMMEKQKMEKAMEGKKMMESGADAMMKKEGGEMPALSGAEGMVKYTGTVLAGKSAPLLDYNKADYDTAIASDKLVVLYFYANWCAICKNETANALYPAFNELTTDKVVGFRISYKDNETDSDEKALAIQYGIPYQHTKVFVKNGKQILKAPDGWSKARYLDEINKALAQ